MLWGGDLQQIIWYSYYVYDVCIICNESCVFCKPGQGNYRRTVNHF